MIDFLHHLFDIITYRIPAESYESVYIASILGVITFFFAEKNKRNTILIIIFAIAFAIIWRTFFYSRIISKRYFQIILIPIIVFAAYGCSCVPSLLSTISAKFRSRPVFSNAVFSFFLILLVVLEIIKIQKNDFYCYIKLQSFDKYVSRDKYPDSNVLFLEDKKEFRRIPYYSNIPRGNVHLVKEKGILDISLDVPGIYLFKNVFFFFENGTSHSSFESSGIINGLDDLKQVCRVYTSKKKNKQASCYLYSPDLPAPNKIDPAFVRGKNRYRISPCNLVLERASLLYHDFGFYPVVSGKQSMVFSKDFIAVPVNNRMDLTVEIKNIGNNKAYIYVGYALYDKDRISIKTGYYPFNNQILKVVSAKTNDSHLIVDKFPQWYYGNYIALDAKEDLSDIPNQNLLSGTVSNVKTLSDGTVSIQLTKPLEKDIPSETSIRLNGGPGTYIYETSKIISPGDSFSLSASIAKYQSYPYLNSTAVMRDVCFIKPLILSFSTNEEENLIEIIKWDLDY